MSLPMRLFTNPSPFIPLPLIRGEGREFVKGASPLLIPLLNSPSLFLLTGLGGVLYYAKNNR